MGWSKWLQSNFDKLLLTGIFATLCLFVVHLQHHQSDQELVLWGREATGTVLGALLTLVTGSALKNHTQEPQPPQIIPAAPQEPKTGAE